MPFTLTLPKLSPTMEEGTIVKWHKKEGDEVQPGDLLMEVATDKATVEFNSLEKGWLRKILVREGKELKVNEPVAIFSDSKEENITSYKPEGLIIEPVQKQENGSKNASAKEIKEATPQIHKASFSAEPPLESPHLKEQTASHEGRILVSPAARHVAKEKGLDLANLSGTGPSGRIMLRDLEKAKSAGSFGFGKKEAPKIAPGSFELENLTPMRKVIAQRLQEAKNSIPHFYVTLTINAEPLYQLREQLRNVEIKLTYNDFIVRASALALREHPVVNSGFDSGENAVIRFKTIDISVAVSVSGGLITPILRHADFKSVAELSGEIRELSKRAKEGKLEAQEYKGGSFTVSNLGMYGVTEFQAIINPPQAAILAVGGLLESPVVREGTVVPGKIINLTLSSDHRVVDGVAASEFLQSMKKFLENPASLLI